MSDKIKAPKEWKVLNMGKRLTPEQKIKAARVSDSAMPLHIPNNVK